MKTWKAKIKEKGSDHVLTPEYCGEATRRQMIEFWGLNNPDVEWYELELVEQ